jgi:hypothetical protein
MHQLWKRHNADDLFAKVATAFPAKASLRDLDHSASSDKRLTPETSERPNFVAAGSLSKMVLSFFMASQRMWSSVLTS